MLNPIQSVDPVFFILSIVRQYLYCVVIPQINPRRQSQIRTAPVRCSCHKGVACRADFTRPPRVHLHHSLYQACCALIHSPVSLPKGAASRHSDRSYSHPFARAHCNTAGCPPSTAALHVFSSLQHSEVPILRRRTARVHAPGASVGSRPVQQFTVPAHRYLTARVR